MAAITSGNILLMDQRNLADQNQVVEIDRSTGATVQHLSIDPTYTGVPYASWARWYGPNGSPISRTTVDNGDILAIGSNSKGAGPAVFKIDANGVGHDLLPASVVPSGALTQGIPPRGIVAGQVPNPNNSAYGLAVWAHDIDHGSLTFRRFWANASGDITKTLHADAPTSPYATSAIADYIHLSLGAWNPRTDEFFLVQKFEMDPAGFAPYGPSYMWRITRYPCATAQSGAGTSIRNYTYTVSKGIGYATSGGAANILGISYDALTDALYVAVQYGTQDTRNDPHPTGNNVVIEKLNPVDGTLLATYPINATTVAGWDDQTALAGSGGDWPGGPACMVFEAGRLWAFIWNADRVNSNTNNNQIMYLDFATGLFNVLPNFQYLYQQGNQGPSWLEVGIAIH